MFIPYTAHLLHYWGIVYDWVCHISGVIRICHPYDDPNFLCFGAWGWVAQPAVVLLWAFLVKIR